MRNRERTRPYTDIALESANILPDRQRPGAGLDYAVVVLYQFDGRRIGRDGEVQRA